VAGKTVDGVDPHPHPPQGPGARDSGFQARDIVAPVPATTREFLCGDVVNWFVAMPELSCLAVLDREGRPVGLVEREHLLTTFAHQIKAELYRRRPIDSFLQSDFLAVDAETDLDQVSARIADDYPQALATGFVITEGGRYLGIGTGIRLLSKIVSMTRQREAGLEAARFAAVAADRAKSTFLASISHEIRTPLNAVVGSLELLAEAATPAERQALIDSASAGANSLLQIIGDVLDFSKIESDRIELEQVELDPASLVREVAALFSPKARQRGLFLRVEIGSGIPARIVGDPLRLRQVVMNLAGNALKFTRHGGIALRLSRCWSAAEALRLRVEISDSGIGFAPDQAGRLFEAFTQENESTARQFGGTGLGLAICRRLVRLMGGTIGADGAPGQGATFWFELPVTAAPGPPLALIPPDLRGSTILLVDDGSHLPTLPEVLTRAGARVGAAETLLGGIRAVRAAQLGGQPFDAVILAPRLPDGDPCVLSAVLAGTATRLVLTTGAETAATLGRLALTHDGDRVVALPCPPEAIAHAVAEAVGRNQPAAAAPRPAVRESAGESGPGESGPGDGGSGDLVARCAGRPLLVIDDLAINLTVARRQLIRLGLSCDSASDGFEGLGLAAARRYALILVDRTMPEMDGLEFARRLRRLEQGLGWRTPMVAITAHAQPEDVRLSLEAGLDDHLTKPITLARLVATLDRWLPGAAPGAAPAADAPAHPAPPPLAPPLVLPVAPPPVDLARLAAILGEAEPEEMREVFALFSESFPPLLARIDSCWRQGDQQALFDAAHSAKGAARNLGADQLSRLLAELEEAAARGRTADQEALIRAAHEAFRALETFIRAY